MKLMLVEPEATGHRMVLYTRHIIREARQRGWELRLLTTERATRHRAFAMVQDENDNRLPLHLMPHVDVPFDRPTAGALLRYQMQQYRAISSGFRRAAAAGLPSFVYQVNLDYCDKIMAVRGSPFGPVPFAGMLMAVGFHRQRVGILAPPTRHDALYEWAFRRVLRIDTLKAMTVIDPSLLPYTRELPKGEREKIRYVPDAAALSEGADTRRSAREALGIREDQLVLLLFGSISRRKGLQELLETLGHPQVPVNVVALIAGRQDEYAHALLANGVADALRAAGRLFEMNDFLDDTDAHRAFCASDLAWLNYQQFYGMSGVLIQAGAHGLPVVACCEGLIGWLTRQHELGECVSGGRITEAAAAIARLAGDADRRARLGAHGREFAVSHTTEAFAAAVCDAIADRQTSTTSS